MSEEKKALIKEILEWVGCIIIALVLAILVRYFIGAPTVVQNSSMYPTLIENQRLILNRTIKIGNQLPNRGDIVTFEAPSKTNVSAAEAKINGPIAVYDKKIDNIFSKFRYYVLEIGKISYIKRVIAFPGEHVKIENGKVYINGEELEEDYLQDGVVTDGRNFSDFIVPDGTLFLLGDNRAGSNDCRIFGCIPIEKLESKVWIRFWPLNLFGKVK